MSFSNIQNKKYLKVKIKKKFGRLEKVITESLPKNLGISRTRVKNLISNKLIYSSISKKPIELDHNLLDGETLIFELEINKKNTLNKEKMDLDIIFDDEHFFQ